MPDAAFTLPPTHVQEKFDQGDYKTAYEESSQAARLFNQSKTMHFAMFTSEMVTPPPC